MIHLSSILKVVMECSTQTREEYATLPLPSFFPNLVPLHNDVRAVCKEEIWLSLNLGDTETEKLKMVTDTTGIVHICTNAPTLPSICIAACCRTKDCKGSKDAQLVFESKKSPLSSCTPAVATAAGGVAYIALEANFLDHVPWKRPPLWRRRQ